MSSGREMPILDLMDDDVHVTRIETPGPVCYRIEQGKHKVILPIQHIYAILGGIRSDYEFWILQKSLKKAAD